jgi:hypothetical protein
MPSAKDNKTYLKINVTKNQEFVTKHPGLAFLIPKMPGGLSLTWHFCMDIMQKMKEYLSGVEMIFRLFRKGSLHGL